jgi:uncharacterized protein (TIGR00661 family)
VSKNILICPLDWGLGHATRCIPVIRELQSLGHHVVIAGSGPSLDLLRIEFPLNKFYSIESYGINYSRKVSLMIHLFMKLPSLPSIVRKENKQIAEIVEQEKIDFIISDNRYGCYHRSIPSAIIIHQLSLRLPLIMKGAADSYNLRLIKKFNQCWIPDTPDRKLAGILSTTKSKKVIPNFIGPLSRMTGTRMSSTSFKILGLVSGPEPQRTMFEEILFKQLNGSNLDYYVVRGLPSEQNSNFERSFTHLPSQQLNDMINAAEVIVCRPGYSTIMDLAFLKKKAIFVPTPGQTEQLYLARELEKKKIAPMVLQRELSLTSALSKLGEYSGFTDDYLKTNYLQNTLREFLD